MEIASDPNSTLGVIAAIPANYESAQVQNLIVGTQSLDMRVGYMLSPTGFQRIHEDLADLTEAAAERPFLMYDARSTSEITLDAGDLALAGVGLAVFSSISLRRVQELSTNGVGVVLAPGIRVSDRGYVTKSDVYAAVSGAAHLLNTANQPVRLLSPEGGPASRQIDYRDSLVYALRKTQFGSDSMATLFMSNPPETMLPELAEQATASHRLRVLIGGAGLGNVARPGVQELTERVATVTELLRAA
jgi:hypothetical protein